MRKPTDWNTGKAGTAREVSEICTEQLRRGNGDSMHARGRQTQHGKPCRVVARETQPDAREGQAGRDGVADRPIVPMKPGNDGGGKGPWFKVNARSGKGPGIG